MDLTDKEYVGRCRDGHQEDFRLLVDRYQKPLSAYLAGRLWGWPAGGGSGAGIVCQGLPVLEEAAEAGIVLLLTSGHRRTGRQGTTALPEAPPAGL